MLHIELKIPVMDKLVISKSNLQCNPKPSYTFLGTLMSTLVGVAMLILDVSVPIKLPLCLAPGNIMKQQGLMLEGILIFFKQAF